MSNNTLFHLYDYSLQNQENPQKNHTARGDVRQDKRRSPPPRPASLQADAGTNSARAVEANTYSPPQPKNQKYEKRTAKLTLWVEPGVKEHLRRRAEREDISLSALGAQALKGYLQQDADIHYSATLAPLIEATLDRRMAARDNRLALLLVRACLGIEQTRSLATNILGRQPKITPDVLNDILDQSLTDAKKKLTRRSPELEELITEVKSWLVEKETAEGKP